MTEATISTPGIEMSTDSVVRVRDLHVEFPTQLGVVRALNGVSFDVPRGRVLGIVGESGCGKSVTARAILRIIERPGRIVSGDIHFRPARHSRMGSHVLQAARGHTRPAQATVPPTPTPAESSSSPPSTPRVRRSAAFAARRSR